MVHFFRWAFWAFILRGPVNLATWQPLGGLGKPKHSRQPTGQPNAQNAHGIKGKTAPVARWAR